LVSFDDVQSVFRREKTAPNLVEVPPGFFGDARKLTDTLKGRHKVMLERLLSDIVERRRTKLVLAALRGGEPPAHALDAEKKLFARIFEVISESDEGLFAASSPDEPTEEPSRQEVLLASVRLLKALPAFTGADLNSYGPYKEGETVKVPSETAEILLKQGAAEEVKDG